MTNEKEAYRKKMEAQIDEWRAEWEVLRARAKKLEADGRMEAETWLQDLNRKKALAEARLAEFRKAGDAAWSDLRGGLDRAIAELGEAVRSAASKFSSGS
jgi:hypothetical protein